MNDPEKRVIEIRPDSWYTIAGLARHLKVSRDTISRQIKAGLLPAFCLPTIEMNRKRQRRVYRVYRIKGADILKWLEGALKKVG